MSINNNNTKSPSGAAMKDDHDLDFYKFILEHLPIAVFTVDSEMKITIFNALAEELTGYSDEEAIGCYCGDILQSGMCQAQCLMKKITDQQKPVIRVETTIVNKNGESIPVGLNTAVFSNNEGKFIGALDAFLDLRPLKALERERANFASMIAHDMKTSLVIIGGFVRRLLKKPAKISREKQKESLEIIHKEGSKLEALIKDFIEFSRLHSGKLELHFSPTSLDSELMDLHEIYAPQAQEAGIVLELNNEKTLSIIDADTNNLKRVFCNLLDNAIKYSQEKSKITITTLETDSDVLVEIEDQGAGIASQDLPYIFEPFHRGCSDDGKEGFGIGLSIVNAIIKGHGGQVLVESKPGEGSLFTVVLPKTVGCSNIEETSL